MTAPLNLPRLVLVKNAPAQLCDFCRRNVKLGQVYMLSTTQKGLYDGLDHITSIFGHRECLEERGGL